MSDQQPRADRPVLNGVVALIAVTLGVGAVLAAVVLVGTKVLGVGGDEQASSGSTARESMYLPSPQKTDDPQGPLVTLNTEDPNAPDLGSQDATDEASESATDESSSAAAGTISLTSAATSVATGERIYFSGTYPGGEGAILFVQRFQNNAWSDFPASVGVTNGTFSSYLFTGVSGLNRFRVIDRDKNVISNEIRVQVG